MQFKTLFFATLAVFIPAIAASPAKRGPGPVVAPVEICTGEDFTGACTQLDPLIGACASFPDGWNDDVSSVRSIDNWACTYYFDSACDASYGSFATPGGASYPTLPAEYDNQFNSVSCSPSSD